MSNFLESKKVRATLWILGGSILLLMVFGLGMSVGYERAGFAAGFDKNYYRIFFGGPHGGIPPMMPAGLSAPSMPTAIHGVVGAVIDLSTSTISVKDEQGNEQSIVVSAGTNIRNGDGDVSIASLTLGDVIAVIGGPNDMGQIEARFIRILATSSSSAPIKQL
jgi:hypothetical protein